MIAVGDLLRRAGGADGLIAETEFVGVEADVAAAGAAGELKVHDARVPVVCAVAENVLLRVPEGAVVDGIDGHGAVVAPAIDVGGLRAAADHDGGFGFELTGGIGGNASGESDRGIDRAPADAVAESDVADFVHGDAAHPAIVGVGRVGALLRDHRIVARRLNLIPAHAAAAADRDRVIDDQRFVTAEVAIGEAIHQAVGQRVELVIGRAAAARNPIRRCTAE